MWREQFGHETLAETHDLQVALALGIEVAAALAAADRQRCQRVLEDLFEAEKFQDALVHARVESQATFVRSDRAAELDAESSVDVDRTRVINPRHAKLNQSLRLDEPFENSGLAILRVSVNDRFERFGDLPNGLEKLDLSGVAGLDPDHELIGESGHP